MKSKWSIPARPDVVKESPLSFGQQSLWFIQTMNPASGAYNTARAVSLRGNLDGPALRRAFWNLVDLHSSLRTHIYIVHGKPFQRISKHFEVPFAEEDASSWNDEELSRRLSEAAERPFDLERDPLLRVTLFRRADRDCVLLLVVHQIICDSWTLAKLISDLTILYAAEKGGSPATIEPSSVEYTDFVCWQLEMVESTAEQSHWEYWRRQLLGELSSLNLPTSPSRPPFKTYRGRSYGFRIEDDLARQLKTNAATLDITLLAAFNVLLYRYTGQDDIVVGTSTSLRHRPEFSEVMGYLDNALVLRTDLSGDPTFSELLVLVRKTVNDAAEHQAYPFARLVKRLQPTRDPSRSPLFDVMFVFKNPEEPGRRVELNGLSLEHLPLERRTAQFDLTLTIEEGKEGLSGTINYNTDTFDEAAVTQLVTHYLNVLSGIAMQPHVRLHRLPLLSAKERKELFEDFNVGPPLLRTTGTLQQLFEQQAALTPANIAVIADEQVSYQELNDRAEQVAERLRLLLQAGPEVCVGVLLRRRPALLASLLGVLKAGGAYVPLDPDYPRQRVQFMLTDSGARALVTERKLLEEWAPELPAGIEVVVIEDLFEGKDGGATVDIERRISAPPTAENLAYVIYTSGSTGIPKGVMITHGSAFAFLKWALETYTREQLSGVLAATSVCFDLSIFELFVPLSCGGAVVLAENALEWPPGVAEQVILINSVPSVMSELLRTRGGTLPKAVRVINLAGESLPRSLVDKLYGLEQIEQVWNLYGPSEDTTYSTGALMRREETLVPPIGRPLNARRAYILDSHLEPVPLGVVGQLCLSGAGLARGYLERRQLTAERFVPDPHGPSGARMYLTGDMARFLPSGEIEYLGRRDQQVKIRGFRIEFGEVEAAVRSHEAVADAVVVARDGSGGRLLVCYYVVVQEVSKGELRRWIRERLPEHMVPTIFVQLESLPLTPSGKVDRRNLPEVEAERQRGEHHNEPRDEIEEIVSDVWAEVLGVEPIDVRQNFFALGGHSLLITEITSRLRNVIGCNVDLQTFFSNPTVAELSTIVKEQLLSHEKAQAALISG
jgi:amino acid adenylation domain-containing protein